MKLLQATWIAILVVTAGCTPKPAPPAGGAPNIVSPAPSTSTIGGAAGLAPLDDPAGGQGQQPAATSPPTPEVPSPTPPATPDTTSPAQPTEQVKAEAGVGQKGQSLEQQSGVLVESAKAFFRVEQKMVFQVQVPQAMSLFKATEGRDPNSQEEFMTKIIAANNINLPNLPQGHKYVYDVQKAELMVEKPKK